MRRILSFLAASALLLALMNAGMWAACSPKPGDESNTSETAKEASAEAAPDSSGEAVTETTTETPAETVAEVTPDAAPDLAPDKTPDLAPDKTPDLAPDKTPRESTPGNRLLGEECAVTSDCKSGLGFSCVDPGGLNKKVCTKSCSANADCDSISGGAGNGLCDKHPGITSYCLSKCTSDAECAALANTPVCATTESHCWVRKPLGDSCARESECATGLKCVDPGGLGKKICTKACVAAADCGAGSLCDVSHPGLAKNYCLKPCTKDTTCALFNNTPICASEGHCWTKKDIGGTCADSKQCTTGLDCKDPGSLGAKVCTKSCTADGDCPGGKCQNSQCLPRCTTKADCGSYSTIFACNTNGYCWKN